MSVLSDWPTKIYQVRQKLILCRSAGLVKNFCKKFFSFPILFFYTAIYLVKDKYSVMAGWPISFSPNAKPGVKRKQENVATKADKRKYEDKRDRYLQEHWLEKIPWLQHDERGMRCTICCNFYDNSKQQQGSSTNNLFLTG